MTLAEFFNIIKFKSYIKFIKNMLFVHSTNILKRQNYHIDYFIFRSISRLVVHIIVEPAIGLNVGFGKLATLPKQPKF